MQTKTDQTTEDKTNYSFLLKCLAAAAVTASIAATALVLLSKSTVASAALITAGATAGPIGALLATIVVLAAVCFLPCMFGCGNGSRSYYPNYGYSGSSLGYAPFFPPLNHNHHHHNHHSYPSSTTHSGNVHAHASANVHGHG